MKNLDWRTVPQDQRWLWWQQLWGEVCGLRTRYELPVRYGWWEHAVQLETLAALAAWTAAYDDGEWDDAPGKLSLLLDLERIAGLLRDGNEPFHPERHRRAFDLHLKGIGCSPPVLPFEPKGKPGPTNPLPTTPGASHGTLQED